MKILIQRTHKYVKRGLLLGVAFFVVFAFSVSFAYFFYDNSHINKIYSGIKISNIDVSGKTKKEARELINNKIDKINTDGIKFYYENKSIDIFPTIASLESDSAYTIIDFKIDSAVNQAFKKGRDKTWFSNLKNKILLLVNNQNIKIEIITNEEKILRTLKDSYSMFETNPMDAKIIYNESFVSSVEGESFGNLINYETGLNKLKNNLKNLDNSPITLSATIQKPSIYKNDALPYVSMADNLLNNAPFKLTFNAEKHDLNFYSQKSWEIDKQKISTWISLKNIEGQNNQKKVILSLDKIKVEEYLDSIIYDEIKIAPIDAKFEIKNGRVIEFQESKDGLELNREATFNLLENAFLKELKEDLEIAVTELKSDIQTKEVNEFGLSEVLGTGHSSFSGSPQNRRHNIKTGSDALNGLLIKPGEEFSLVGALGNIDAESGYLPELVIKGNETIPEYGGGLCQIGTTLFRTVTASGLPVTMRRNHSYRVSYYEPAGTDATIYDPWPDFKFLNDTENHVLIQTRIEGDDIYFDFWGTSDGRIASSSKPTIYNIVRPDPVKIIETLALPVGQKKCTESSHNGADAFFDYQVVFSDGTITERRFSSHYRPWQAVCLIGVEKLSEEISTSSPEIIKE